MRLILLRHGITDDNLKKRYCGLSDIGLNKTGRIQAKKLKTKFSGLKVDVVFCSDLKRSYQTAKIIFGSTGRQIIKNPHLREINFGKWEGLTYSQILRRYPSTCKRWLVDPFSVNIPKGQKLSHFIRKIKNELKKIVDRNTDKTVAVVTHAGVIRVILNTVKGIKKKGFWQLKINPCSVYIIEYKKQLRPRVYRKKWVNLS